MYINYIKDNNKQGSSGFTLTELLIVVAIIGILAAIALPKLFPALTKAKEAKTKHRLSCVRQAIELYAIDHNNQFPDNLNDLFPDYYTGSELNPGAVCMEEVGDGPQPGDWVWDVDDVNMSLTRTISAAGDQGGWIYCRTNGDVWIDEDGTSLIDGEEYRFW